MAGNTRPHTIFSALSLSSEPFIMNPLVSPLDSLNECERTHSARSGLRKLTKAKPQLAQCLNSKKRSISDTAVSMATTAFNARLQGAEGVTSATKTRAPESTTEVQCRHFLFQQFRQDVDISLVSSSTNQAAPALGS